MSRNTTNKIKLIILIKSIKIVDYRQDLFQDNDIEFTEHIEMTWIIEREFIYGGKL